MSLADSAIRLRRTNWRDRANLLAEELYIMFLQEQEPESGPITINLGDDSSGAGADDVQIPPESTRDPLGGWQFPDLNLPDTQLREAPVVENIPGSPIGPTNADGEGAGERSQRVETRTIHERTVVPGIVTASSGGSHTVTLYPNSVTVGHSMSVSGVTDMAGTTHAAGTRVAVFRYLQVEQKTTTYLETVRGEEREIRKETGLKIKRTVHEIIGGSGTGGGIPCKITGGGPGSNYTADLYPAGLSGNPVAVNVVQISIDPEETIPVDTWAMASLIGGVYYVNVPVWA